MKPLLEVKITRENAATPLREWESAEHHQTHDGRNEFMARMLERIKAAQQPLASVAQIKGRKKA